jgi:hypothetical protein
MTNGPSGSVGLLRLHGLRVVPDLSSVCRREEGCTYWFFLSSRLHISVEGTESQTFEAWTNAHKRFLDLLWLEGVHRDSLSVPLLHLYELTFTSFLGRGRRMQIILSVYHVYGPRLEKPNYVLDFLRMSLTLCSASGKSYCSP